MLGRLTDHNFAPSEERPFPQMQDSLSFANRYYGGSTGRSKDEAVGAECWVLTRVGPCVHHM